MNRTKIIIAGLTATLALGLGIAGNAQAYNQAQRDAAWGKVTTDCLTFTGCNTIVLDRTQASPSGWDTMFYFHFHTRWCGLGYESVRVDVTGRITYWSRSTTCGIASS